VIDIKEPANGPLGMASAAVWKEIRDVVPRGVPISVALGDLSDWDEINQVFDWSGISYRKLGLAKSLSDWPLRWWKFREHQPGPPWVAVIYSDWKLASAPSPDEVLDVALGISDCVGVLIDTWDKSTPSRIDDEWFPVIARAKAAGRRVALAGGLDAAAIRRLSPLGPDLFAVRTAACRDGLREGKLDARRVSDLCRLVATIKV
jgi:hypothetical protein